MTTSAPTLAPIKSTNPFRVISWLFALLGLFVFAVANWLIGACLVLVAILIDRKRYHCGACGNRVEKTSSLCPVCQSRLTESTYRVKSGMRRAGGR